jgi:hypothetical protein
MRQGPPGAHLDGLQQVPSTVVADAVPLSNAPRLGGQVIERVLVRFALYQKMFRAEAGRTFTACCSGPAALRRVLCLALLIRSRRAPGLHYACGQLRVELA